MKKSIVIFLSAIASASLVSSVAAAGETWESFGSGACATAIAPSWAIGCNDSGAIFELESSGFVQVPNSFATTVTVDTGGNPWVINASGTIYRWTGSGFTKFDASRHWSSISVGSPTAAHDIWAIDSTQQIYNFSGTATTSGTWSAISGAFGTKIAALGTTQSCSGGSIHVPMVINAAHNIYEYGVTSGQACSAGSFSQITANGAAASDITVEGTALGLDGNTYTFDPTSRSFSMYLGGFGSGTAHIAADYTGDLWAIDTDGVIAQAFLFIP